MSSDDVGSVARDASRCNPSRLAEWLTTSVQQVVKYGSRKGLSTHRGGKRSQVLIGRELFAPAEVRHGSLPLSFGLRSSLV